VTEARCRGWTDTALAAQLVLIKPGKRQIEPGGLWIAEFEP
jgi:hypothetical protein